MSFFGEQNGEVNHVVSAPSIVMRLANGFLYLLGQDFPTSNGLG